MKEIVLIAHNIRSSHNVGSLMRTAEGLGIDKMYLTGYSPHPKTHDDSRLPHLAEKISRQINKTALDAEQTLTWHYQENVFKVIDQLRDTGYQIVALEQTKQAIPLKDFKPAACVALIVGREVEGIESEVLSRADTHIEIEMRGQKESFNVAVATGIALYHLSIS